MSEETAPRTRRAGKGYKRTFKYKYDDLAALFGMSQVAVRKAAQRGRFDPNSLASIIEFKRGREEQVAAHQEAFQEDIRNRLRNAMRAADNLHEELQQAHEAYERAYDHDRGTDGHPQLDEPQAEDPLCAGSATSTNRDVVHLDAGGNGEGRDRGLGEDQLVKEGRTEG